MKRFVMILAMYAGSFGPAFALRAPTPPHADEQAAFDYACHLMKYDCKGVALPKVEWTQLCSTYGLFGGYDGGDTIILDSEVLRFADPAFVQSVLAHETTHYLDVTLGYVAFSPEMPSKDEVCKSEFNAWRVGNAYVITHGRPDLADFSWAERYGCFGSHSVESEEEGE